MQIDKKTIEHLAALARLKLSSEEEDKLLRDLQSILGYFEELQKLDVKKPEGISNTTYVKNVFREDDERQNTNRGAGVDQFPEASGGFLKIPNVFE